MYKLEVEQKRAASPVERPSGPVCTRVIGPTIFWTILTQTPPHH